MNKQRFISSVMADSGTDRSNKDLKLVYVRFLENGLPVNKYAAVVELKKADANGVIASINTGMLAWKIGKVKQLPSEVYMLEGTLLLSYMWKFPGSLVCIA